MSLDCPKASALLHAYVDGELELTASLDVEAHLASCADCRRELETHRALRRVLRGAGLAYTAPARLRRKILPPVPARRAWGLRPLVLAASFAALALVIRTAVLRQSADRAEDGLVSELVADHASALMSGRVAEVPSSDKHTVKPWFQGKLDYSPTVVDASAQGFPLVGGRLSRAGGRPIAALAYRRGGHAISVFVRPSEGSEPAPRPRALRGYRVLRSRGGDMTFWAVSDLNEAELARFLSLLRE
jgi:anti-sigma factor RsiW